MIHLLCISSPSRSSAPGSWATSVKFAQTTTSCRAFASDKAVRQLAALLCCCEPEAALPCPGPAPKHMHWHRWLTQGAQLIAPLLGPEDASQGFAWCCEAVQQQGLGAVQARLCRAQAAALLDSCRAAEAAALLQASPGPMHVPEAGHVSGCRGGAALRRWGPSVEPLPML